MATKFDINDGTTYRLWNVCGCGCGEVVRNRFLPGHDAKLKSQQLKGNSK